MESENTETNQAMNSSQEKVEENLEKKVDSVQTKSEHAETQEDPNWRAFREARKKDRAAREEAERRASEKEAEVAALKAAMEVAFSKAAPTPQAYQQYYGMSEETEETEDQRIERKVLAAIAQKEAAAEKARIEREQQEYPARLQQMYPDFNQVISQENLDYLDYHYPEVSRPLQRFQDGFDKWSDIYRAVKKLVPNHSNAKKDAARAEANQMKPKSISSTGVTNPGESIRPSWQDLEKRRADRWAEMQKIQKSIG